MDNDQNTHQAVNSEPIPPQQLNSIVNPYLYQNPSDRHSNKKIIVIVILMILIGISSIILLVVPAAVMFFVSHPVQVAGKSMEPNYPDKQKYILNKMAYKNSQPQRNDVIVYTDSARKDYLLIHRVIGLPGETVVIKDGSVFINGQQLEEPYVVGKTIETKQKRIVEGQNYTIPQNTVFVLGDNREHSALDSRDRGFIPINNIMGKIWIKY